MRVALCGLLLWTLAWPDYRAALPGYRFEFPRDHGSHPDFKLEWWYFTGNLRNEAGRRFGYELTFFRTGLEDAVRTPSRWQARDLYPAHFAITDPEQERFVYYEKLNRTSPGVAGAAEGTLEVWNENWVARLEEGGVRLRASQDGSAVDLWLVPEKPPVIHGTDGVSQKGSLPGMASHYYSWSRLATSGELRLGGERWRVEGLSWMDHEFSTSALEEGQVGWDWFSLQLEGGEDLMLFQLRRKGGTVDPRSAATVVSVSGEGRHLSDSEFELEPAGYWTSPRSGGRYPVRWRIRIPGLGAELEVEPLMDDQELVTTSSTGVVYWEGAIRVTGRWRGGEAKGSGYLEMTGYGGERPEI